MMTLLDLILDSLKKGPKSRPELVKITGCPRTTIYDYLAWLKHTGLVESYTAESNRLRGRPHTMWRLIPQQVEEKHDG